MKSIVLAFSFAFPTLALADSSYLLNCYNTPGSMVFAAEGMIQVDPEGKASGMMSVYRGDKPTRVSQVALRGTLAGEKLELQLAQPDPQLQYVLATVGFPQGAGVKLKGDADLRPAICSTIKFGP